MEVSATATLDYTLGGTDVDNFEMENDLLTVTAVEAVVLEEGTDYTVTVAANAADSTPSETVVSVTCPHAG